MNVVLWVLAAIGVMGAIDTIAFHEIASRLAARPAAWRELRLHACRDVFYLILFPTLAWNEPHGAFAGGIAAIVVAEVVVTAFDFIVEWETRVLPTGERALHAVIAVTYGAFAALLAPSLLTWATLPAGFAPARYGVVSWFLTLLALGVAFWSVRDGVAAVRMHRLAATV